MDARSSRELRGRASAGPSLRLLRSPLVAALLVLVVLSALLGGGAPGAAASAAAPSECVRTDVTAATTVTLGQPAGYVAVYWPGAPQARVTVAFSADGVHFGKPLEAGRDEVGEQRAGGTTYGALRDAQGAVAVRVTTDRPLARLTLLALADGGGAAGLPAAALGAAAPRTAVYSTVATTTPAQPPVTSRAQWGADESLMTWAPAFYPTKKLIVHHTAGSNEYPDAAAAAAEVRAIYYYHAVTQGWGDIGYNFLIDAFGTVYEGRYSRDYAGANPSGDDAAGNAVTGGHTLGWNSGTLGVVVLGTFTDQDITPAARRSLEALLAWAASRNGIDPQATETFTNPVSGATITTANIAGHRDYLATVCPGTAFYATLPALRAAVALRLEDARLAPTAPRRLRAVGGRRQVSLTWAAATDTVGVAGYRIWRARGSARSYTLVATVPRRTYVDTGLARSARYRYRVQAYDAANNAGPFSRAASARTR